MNDLVTKQPLEMANIMNILGHVQPPQIPSLDYNSGYFKRKFHNWKLGDISTAYAREEEISNHQLAIIKNRLEGMMKIATFGAELENSFKRLEHEKRMMEFDEYRAQCEIRKMDAEAKEAEFSAKTAELDYKARLKSMKEEYGDDFQS
jgi:hypothetical protein